MTNEEQPVSDDTQTESQSTITDVFNDDTEAVEESQEETTEETESEKGVEPEETESQEEEETESESPSEKEKLVTEKALLGERDRRKKAEPGS